MDKKFKTTINTTETLEISSKDANALNSSSETENQFQIIYNAKNYKATLVAANFYKKTYTITINNNTYSITLQNELDNLINKMGFAISNSKIINAIKAPMPGLILDVLVKAEQEVQANDNLLILEAMKMENSIIAPRTGKIKKVTIQKGDAVIKNQLLIEFYEDN